jgi:hypothetical protein
MTEIRTPVTSLLRGDRIAGPAGMAGKTVSERVGPTYGPDRAVVVVAFTDGSSIEFDSDDWDTTLDVDKDQPAFEPAAQVDGGQEEEARQSFMNWALASKWLNEDLHVSGHPARADWEASERHNWDDAMAMDPAPKALFLFLVAAFAAWNRDPMAYRATLRALATDPDARDRAGVVEIRARLLARTMALDPGEPERETPLDWYDPDSRYRRDWNAMYPEHASTLAARAEWERILADEPDGAGRDSGMNFGRQAGDKRAARGTASWYAVAGSVVQDHLRPIAGMITAAAVDLARRREFVRSGVSGWVAVLADMQQWVYSYDTYYEPRPWDWPEDDVAGFVEEHYPGGVIGFADARIAGRVRRPAEVDEVVRLKEQAAARWESTKLAMWLDMAADPREHPDARAAASRIALGGNIDDL